MTKVCCPNCGEIRTIDGTEKRVRCSNKKTCGSRYYVKSNTVPFNGTDNYSDSESNIYIEGPETSVLVGLDETSDFKRLMWLAIMGKSWRGTNEELDLKLKEKIMEIRKL